MITIGFDEGEQFMYNTDELSVYSFNKVENGRYYNTGRIRFASLREVEQFREMLEFIEKHSKEVIE